jgi:transposase
MLGPQKERRLDRPVLASIEQLVPTSNVYRQLEAQLDLSFVREWAGELYAERGRPSIDPVVFFKLQLIMFFEGLRSERKLIETASLHLAHRWYLGYALDEPLPDHSSLTRVRQRLGVAIFQRLFERVVELCQAAGWVWGNELFFDGTKVLANADFDSLTPRFAEAARAHVAHLFAEEPTAAPGVPRPAPTPNTADAGGDAPAPTRASGTSAGHTPLALPTAGEPSLVERLAAENQAHWKLLEEHRLDPHRSASGAYQRSTNFRVSTTDADAAPMNTSLGGKLGYHDHYAVDGGKARIIVGMVVTPADVQDNQVFLELLDRARFRFHLHVKRAVADSKYATGENLRGLVERGIVGYMPVVDYQQSSPFFRQRDFIYDPETDTYRCPQGETLRFRGNNYQTRARKYEAKAVVCAACPLRAQCTESSKGRVLNRPFDEDYRALARQRETTEAFKRALRKRQVWVEPLFGEAKDWHQLRRFRPPWGRVGDSGLRPDPHGLRGLDNVNMQGLLVAAGQNLTHWLTATIRGQRPTGGQRAPVSFPPFSPL